MAIPQSVVEKLVAKMLPEHMKPEDVIGENGLLKQLTKAILERALQGEMTHHLGYQKYDAPEKKTSNSRNGESKKTLSGEFGEMELAVPRDRQANFEPRIVKKGQRRFAGFDDKILSLYARGMSTREIQGHLEEIYGVGTSPELISSVTDEILKDVREWQTRPLDVTYAILYLDALFVKIRDEGHVKNKAVYLAIGVNLHGDKEVLGMWINDTEGAKFWLRVMTEINHRGVKDILIACVDGLKGFPEAIESVFPQTEVQACIVHLMRNSLKYVSWKERKTVAADLKTIYHALTAEEAERNLATFEEKWGIRFPSIGPIWRSAWERIVPQFSYAPELRRVMYTTNVIESFNSSLRKVSKARGSFPNDDAVLKLFYMAIQKICQKWNRSVWDWSRVLNQLAIVFGDRVKTEVVG